MLRKTVILGANLLNKAQPEKFSIRLIRTDQRKHQRSAERNNGSNLDFPIDFSQCFVCSYFVLQTKKVRKVALY